MDSTSDSYDVHLLYCETSQCQTALLELFFQVESLVGHKNQQ